MVAEQGDVQVQLPALARATVTHIARQVLGSGTAAVADWRVDAVGPNTGHVTRGVYRVKGSAIDGDAHVPWSVILKTISLGASEGDSHFADEAHPLYWKREALAYTSGLLDSLPGGVSAPRCFEVVEQEDGAIWLWLEDVSDAGAERWSLEQYARAAECLGRFNGAYVAGYPFPLHSWLVRTGSPRSLLDHNTWVGGVIADPATWEQPLVSAAFPSPVMEPLLKLWEEREVLLGALDRVPRTFCHLDAWRGNMFARAGARGQRGLTLIDWAFPGYGAMGTDPGDLFGESFCLAELGDTEAALLDEVIFGSYLVGLREIGWQGEADVVRFAFAGFCALKHLFMVFAVLRDLGDDTRHAVWKHLFGRPYEEVVYRQSKLLYYLLQLAEEAWGLVR